MVTSAGWLMVGQVARMIVGLLVGLYVARYLGPESYGVLNYAVSFALLFSGITQFGHADIIIRDLVAYPAQQPETLVATFALRLASGMLAASLAVAVAVATQTDPTTRLMVLIVAAGMVFEALDVVGLWFRSQVVARPTVIAELLATGAAAGLRLAFVLLDKPVIWFAWPFLLDAALRTTFVVAFYRRLGPPLTRWHPEFPRMRNLFAHSWPLALSASLVLILQRIDQVMLGAMLGPKQVGWYAAAVRLSDVWQIVPFAVANTVFPAIIRAKANSQELYEQRMQALYDFMLWLAIAIALPATLIAEPLVRLLYGGAYGPTADILRIHLWGLVFSYTGIIGGRWYIVEGLFKLALQLSLLAVATNIALNLLLIPAYGPIGAAWATLATSGPLLLLQFWDRRTRPPVLMMAKAIVAPIRLSLAYVRNHEL
jgi:PST family polysaccharide transporter